MRRGRPAAWLAWSLLLALPAAPAHGETSLPSLLQPLGLIGYPSRLTAPDLSGGTLEGRPLAMGQLRGKVVLVNFWATWCLECRQEMPALERLHRDLGGRGLTVVGVNAREAASAAGRYARELGLTFPLLLDVEGAINARYGVTGLPTTFLVARDGRGVAFAIGPRDWAGPPARALFEALLAEPGSRGAP